MSKNRKVLPPAEAPIEVRTLLKFKDARDLLTRIFIPEFRKLITHLSTPGGVPLGRPALPDREQNIAFEISVLQLKDRILKYNPVQVACILCINDNTAGDLTDDSLSVMFVGVNELNQPVSEVAIEKWPGIYSIRQLDDLKQDILNPDSNLPITAAERAEYTYTHTMVDDFKAKWDALLADAKANPVELPRPRIKLGDHPFLFFIDPALLKDMIRLKPVAIAGVFIYDDRPNSDFIAPVLVPVDIDKRPMGKLLHTRDRTGFTFSQRADVIDMVLTPLNLVE